MDIRKEIEARHASLSQFCKKHKIRQSYLSHFLNGRRDKVGRPGLAKIRRALEDEGIYRRRDWKAERFERKKKMYRRFHKEANDKAVFRECIIQLVYGRADGPAQGVDWVLRGRKIPGGTSVEYQAKPGPDIPPAR